MKYNPSLLGEDNILIISGKRVCIIFDSDFEYFLADRCQKQMSESVIIYVNLTGKLTGESGVYRTGYSQRDSTDNYTIRGQECL